MKIRSILPLLSCLLIMSQQTKAAVANSSEAAGKQKTVFVAGIDESSTTANVNQLQKETSPVPEYQIPKEINGVEHWYKENAEKNWPDPSHMYISLKIEGKMVCGLLFSSVHGTTRTDRSLLYGRIEASRVTVQYASSYYRDQNQVATAVIMQNGDKLQWKPTQDELSLSWFWGETLLSRIEEPYAPLTEDILTQCKSLSRKKRIDASDLYLDP
jgi:hypothetical protein